MHVLDVLTALYLLGVPGAVSLVALQWPGSPTLAGAALASLDHIVGG
jgi:hypothetical protein